MEMALLYTIGSALLPITLNLSFVTIATGFAYLCCKHEAYFRQKRTVNKLDREIARDDQEITDKKRYYSEEQDRISQGLQLEAEDATDEARAEITSSLISVRKSIVWLGSEQKTLLGRLTFTRTSIIANMREAFAASRANHPNLLKTVVALLIITSASVLTSCSNSSKTEHVIPHEYILLDGTGSMVITSDAGVITDFTIGREVQAASAYPDGMCVTVSHIIDRSQARKVTFSLEPAAPYWSRDEHQRQLDVEQFCSDIRMSIGDVLSDTLRRPATYINRSIAYTIADYDSLSGGSLFLFSDMLEENRYCVNFPDYLKDGKNGLLKHYDSIAARLKRDASYTLKNMDVYIIYLPEDDDEVFRYCRQFWERFFTELGGKVHFISNIDHSLTGKNNKL